MKPILPRLASLVLLGCLIPLAALSADKTRVLVVTGGHDFETNQFYQVFKDNPAITLQTVVHPEAHAWLKSDRAGSWDVLVFYDLWPKITDEARTNLIARLREGKGLVSLHHSLANYSDWDEYAKIIGGKYHLQKAVVDGLEKPASTYKHDVDFRVRVADPNHPVTRGVKDFAIHDETYGLFEVRPTSHALLRTDEATSGPVIAWTSEYGKARVVYLQLGHDHQAYDNPNYRRLVAQAIAWVAKRD
jgi:uncharacterized protein